MDEFLTVSEVASLLKLNPQTVRNWIDRGELPAIRVGRRVRIARADFKALIEAGRTQPRSNAVWEGEVPPPVDERQPADRPGDRPGTAAT